MVVITSGYFDPLHVGHIECFSLCHKLAGDHGSLVVIVNNDHQARLKKGVSFMPEQDRLTIVRSLRCVDLAVLSEDLGPDVSKTIAALAKRLEGHRLVFAKGGDRKVAEVPEAEVCRRLGIDMVDGLGIKIRSSSDILNAWRAAV